MVGAVWGPQALPPPPAGAAGKGRSPPPKAQGETVPRSGEEGEGKHLPGRPPPRRPPPAREAAVKESLRLEGDRGQSAGTPLPLAKFPSCSTSNPQPKNFSQGSWRAREVKGAQDAPGALGQERPGLGQGVDASPITLRKTDPEGKIRAPHSRLPPPGGGLGTVPGALAPSHELHDEVRTSARDWVAAPSPLCCNLSRHPQIPETTPPGPAPAEVQPPSSATYLLGAVGGSRPLGPSVRVGPRPPREAHRPRAGKDSLWALGPPPGRTSSAGRKKPEPRRRSREAGGGPPWPGRAAGDGGPGYAAPSPAEDPLAGPAPLRAPAPPPRERPPGGSPRLTAGRSVRAASRVAVSQPGPRTLRPGPELPPARRGGAQGRGREGEGGERAAPRPYKERPGEGAGRGGEGRRGRKLPQEGAPILPRGRRLHQGPPAPASAPLPAGPAAPAAPARPRPPLPKHRPLMSFPDLPRPPLPPDPRVPEI